MDIPRYFSDYMDGDLMRQHPKREEALWKAKRIAAKPDTKFVERGRLIGMRIFSRGNNLTEFCVGSRRCCKSDAKMEE